MKYTLIILVATLSIATLEAKRGDRYLDPQGYEDNQPGNNSARGQWNEKTGYDGKELGRFRKKLKKALPMYWLGELYTLGLDEDEEKNSPSPSSAPQNEEQYEGFCRPIYAEGLKKFSGHPNAVYNAWNTLPEGCKTNWYGPPPVPNIPLGVDPYEMFAGQVPTSSGSLDWVEPSKKSKVKITNVRRGRSYFSPSFGR